MNVQNNNLPEHPPAARLLHPAGGLSGSSEALTRSGSVAVIMRTKNRPLLLHRALCSVLLQTHQQWKLYLVNDGGSRQDLETILDSYRTAFADRLTVVHHEESHGMERAVNAGFALAVEEFVVIHDDDDSWHPRFLEVTTEILTEPAKARFVGVTTGYQIVQETIKDEIVYQEGVTNSPKSSSLVDISRLLVENSVPPISFLFRRSALEKIGTYNESIPVLGDLDLMIRMMLLGDIENVPDMLARYHRRVDGSGNSYGDPVIGKKALVTRQGILYRNSLLRSSLLERPENLGAVQSMLHAISAARPDPVPPLNDLAVEILKRLQALEKQNKALQRSVDRLKPKKPSPASAKAKPKPTLFRRLRHLAFAPAKWLWRAVSGTPAKGAKPPA